LLPPAFLPATGNGHRSMGIRLATARLFCETLGPLGEVSSKRLLTLGVQDCYFTYDDLVAFLRRHHVRHHPVAPAEVELTSGFKWVPFEQAATYRRCIHQRTFFAALGFRPAQVSSLDASDYEGADIVHDLNVPVPDALHSRYDVIFDSGTLHYVFSVKDSLFNLCRMCRVGGIIVNFNPIDFSDQGFLGLDAELFRDFYSANGFERVTLKFVAMPRHGRAIDRYYLEIPPERFDRSPLPGYVVSVYSVHRKTSQAELTVPLQGVYRRLHQARQASAEVPVHRAKRFGVRPLREAMNAHWLPAAVLRAVRMHRSARRVRL